MLIDSVVERSIGAGIRVIGGGVRIRAEGCVVRDNCVGVLVERWAKPIKMQGGGSKMTEGGKRGGGSVEQGNGRAPV